MKSFNSSVLLLLLSFMTFGQNSLEQLENLKKGQSISEISFEVENEIITFNLSENNAISEELKLQNPELLTFNLSEKNGSRKGKLTLDNSTVIVHVKSGANMTTMVLAGNDIDFDVSNLSRKPNCGTENSPRFFGQNHIVSSPAARAANDLSYGETLRTYRLAIVGTGEFTENNGGTSASALTIATSSVNGINLIFENEASVTMTLVASQFYTNSSTDPFTPDGAGGDGRTNQAAEVIASNFSNSSYDIGHVFHYYTSGSSWGGGGIAGLGVACDNGTFFSGGDSDGISGPNKAAAWSGSFNNIDNSWIQLATHEFGHQFDANHTFNGGGNGNCNGSISSNSAYEIGSGTTIMSYEGLCPASQNVPSNGTADNYFHSTTLDRIAAFLNSAGNCSSNTSNENSIPDAHTNFSGTPFIIPIGTPFELTGIGSDTDNDNLTFQWEQIDEDGAGTPTQAFIGSSAANSTIAPLFKSVPPSNNTTRTFPSLNEILDGNNEDLDFEALPQVSRNMEFSFIVRDNQGGVKSDGTTVSSSSTAGPFKVTSQNFSTTWTADGSNTATVTWDVANTTNETIDCQDVQILLSTDNGNTFSHELIASTTNDGSHTITIPNLPTSVGRIKVKAAENIFFDINDSVIEITSSCAANGATFTPDTTISADGGNAILDLNLTPEYGSLIPSFSGSIENSDEPSTIAGENSGNCINFNGNNTLTDKFSFQVSASGIYIFNKNSGAFGLTMNMYASDFIPSSPCVNWLASSFNNATGSIDNSMSVALNAGIEYTLVMTTFNSGFPASPAPYQIGYSGPGNAIDGAIAPIGFDYFYMAIDENTGSIVEISLDLDLTTFSGDLYSIYGLSAPSGSDFSSYLGTDFSVLQSDFLNFTICGNLSSNSLSINIIGGNTCPGDLNEDGAVNVGDLGLFLGAFGCAFPDLCIGDFNDDGSTNVVDLGGFLGAFGTLCP